MVSNQSTGNPAYNGELDNDPSNPTDCSGSDQGMNVRAAELEAFAQNSVTLSG